MVFVVNVRLRHAQLKQMIPQFQNRRKYQVFTIDLIRILTVELELAFNRG